MRTRVARRLRLTANSIKDERRGERAETNSGVPMGVSKRGSGGYRMSAFDPLQTLTCGLDRSMSRRFLKALLVLEAALLSASCSRTEPPPAKPLADGCYYAGNVPVLKVHGMVGVILIPGPVQQVSVKRFEDRGDGEIDMGKGDAWVEFSPAFVFNAHPLSTRLGPGTSEISMMMKRGTPRPTIDTVAYPNESLELVQGPKC